MKKIKMIGLDLDGTLLNDKKELTSHTREILTRAIDQGVTVLVATGRPVTGIPEVLRNFPGMRYALTSNGGRILDLQEDKVLYANMLSYEMGAAILKIFGDYDTFKEIYFDGRGFVQADELLKVGEYLRNPAMADYIRTTRKGITSLWEKMEEMNGHEMDKIHALFKSQDERLEAKQRIMELGDLSISDSMGTNLEINAPGVNKGMGLIQLGRLLGIEREEIMACGDGNNDLMMLKEVGFGVAMANGADEVKEVADLIAVILGIVEGITEWLPISSTGHMILVEQFLHMSTSHEFNSMFRVVIQLGAIMAVVVLYFNKLNPFSKRKSAKQKRNTINLWCKIVVACLPAAVIGLLFDDILDKYLYNFVVVALMLIIYGVFFILIEKRNEHTRPQVTKLTELTYQMALIIGGFQVLALIPGTSRSGATILGALLIGTSRYVATEFTFYLAIPVMFGASILKVIKFGFHYTAIEVVILLVGCLVAFFVSVFAIKFLMGYIKKHDFKAFGYYRIVLGVLVLLYFLIFG